jgi:hypothetical protein
VNPCVTVGYAGSVPTLPVDPRHTPLPPSSVTVRSRGSGPCSDPAQTTRRRMAMPAATEPVAAPAAAAATSPTRAALRPVR